MKTNNKNMDKYQIEVNFTMRSRHLLALMSTAMSFIFVK